MTTTINASTSAGLVNTADTSGILQLQTAGTAAVTIDASQNVGIGVTPAGTGGCLQLKSGITFPATQSASSDANTLDDYEEGTWTPVIQGTVSAGTVTYVQRPATYTKIGMVVVARTFVIWNSGTGSGLLQIAGLPFTNANTSIYGAVTVANPNGVALTANNYICGGYVSNNQTFMYLTQAPVGGGTSTEVPYDSGGELMLTAVYETA